MADAPTDAIKERIDIVALISESLPLKRAGSNFKARCPFHEEDTPSFMVSPTRQSFRCFGCAESGDIFSWLMKKEGMSFPEALRVLAQRAGVPLTFDRPERREERERLRATLDLATTFYQRILLETAEGEGARAYLKERGTSDASIREWRLGFCPPTPTRIQGKASERGITERDLVSAGVLGTREGRTFEFFQGRILFPLADAHGSVVGLAGRIFRDDRPDSPKYINSPETALYRKSTVLYGLDRAKDAIRKESLAILVEGYTDVIASHQGEVTNVVATSGTALTEDHLRLIRRFTDRVAFAFDADAAGDAATRRALDLALEAGCSVSVVTLPAGRDPADLATADPGGWKRALASRRDVFAFLLERARSRYRLETPEGKKEASADLLPVIAKVRDAVVRGDYAQQIAAVLRIDARFVYDDLRRLKAKQEPSAAGPRLAAAAQDGPRSGTPWQGGDSLILREERFLTLLLAEPALIPKASAFLPVDALVSPDTRALYKALGEWYARERADRESGGSLAELRAHLPEDLRKRLDGFLFTLDVERDSEEWNPADEATTILRSLLRAHLLRELRSRTDELRGTPAGERTERLRAITVLAAELARAEHVSF